MLEYYSLVSGRHSYKYFISPDQLKAVTACQVVGTFVCTTTYQFVCGRAEARLLCLPLKVCKEVGPNKLHQICPINKLWDLF